jgi:small-conductance mechanosensitive channel
MSGVSQPDRARQTALERIERAERNYRWGFAAVAALEAIFGAAYLILMDFRDRLHWLILIAAILTYGIVLVGVINLGVYVNASTQAILRAVLGRDAEKRGEM